MRLLLALRIKWSVQVSHLSTDSCREDTDESDCNIRAATVPQRFLFGHKMDPGVFVKVTEDFEAYSIPRKTSITLLECSECIVKPDLLNVVYLQVKINMNGYLYFQYI